MQPIPQRTLATSQNFLRSRALVDRLLAASSIQAGELVLDLGAGTGLIAERLAQRGCRVIAVEQDPVLLARLHHRFEGVPAVRVWPSDILAMRLPRQPYKVFANIPFNATAAIISRLVRATCPPEDAYLMVQREAAERFVGRPRATLVAVLLMPWFEATIAHRFRRTDFLPTPRVDVVMLRLHKRGPPLVAPEHSRLFRDFVVQVFTTRETTLARGLARLTGTRGARRLTTGLGLDPSVTPASLGTGQWLELFAAFANGAGIDARRLLAGAERRWRTQQRRLPKVHRTRTPGRNWSAGRVTRPRRPGSLSACRPPPGAVLRRGTASPDPTRVSHARMRKMCREQDGRVEKKRRACTRG